MCGDAAAAERLKPALGSTLTAVTGLYLMATKSVPWSYDQRSEYIDQIVSYLETMNDEIPKKDFSKEPPPNPEGGRSPDKPVSPGSGDSGGRGLDVRHARRLPLPTGRRWGPGRNLAGNVSGK